MARHAPKCLGIFGFLFGHKFYKIAGDYGYNSDYCWRCGHRRGSNCG